MPDLTASDDTRLHYVETGDPGGRPVVLVAGFKAPATAWAPQLPALERAGLRVVALDRRGHGASEVGPDGAHTMDRHGADIRDALDALDLDDATVVGQSMGGNAIWALVSTGRVRGIRDVVIVDQTPKMVNSADWAFGFYGYDETNADTFFAGGIPDPGVHPLATKGEARVARLMAALGPRSARAELTPAEAELLHDHATRDWRPVIGAAPVPALFVAGAESEFWPAEHAAAAAALNPRATSTVIADAGHPVNIEQPDVFDAVLAGFLSR